MKPSQQSPFYHTKSGKRESGTEEATTDRPEHLTHVCHEFRSPLHSINLLGDLLASNQDQNLTSRQIRQARTIRNAARSLLQIVDEVLTATTPGKSEVQPTRIPIRLSSLLEQQKFLFDPQAEEKGLTFRVNTPEPEICFISDPLRLEQILRNLISNAIKYTTRGTVSVSTEIRSLDSSESKVSEYLRFRISDTGPGIDEKEGEKIFEWYQRISQPGNDSTQGVGLGLAISRQLAEKLNGCVGLETTSSEGSEFYVDIPLEVADLPNPFVTDSAGSSKPASGSSVSPDSTHVSDATGPSDLSESADESIHPADVSILLVDDNRLHRRALQEYFSESFRTVRTAESANELFQELEEHTPDCILLDLILPDAAGQKILERLSNHPQWNNIPVIVYTGRSLSLKEERLIRSLCAGYIQKSVGSYGRLLNAIRHLTG